VRLDHLDDRISTSSEKGDDNALAEVVASSSLTVVVSVSLTVVVTFGQGLISAEVDAVDLGRARMISDKVSMTFVRVSPSPPVAQGVVVVSVVSAQGALMPSLDKASITWLETSWWGCCCPRIA